MKHKPGVTIRYCVRCHWLPRSAWMARELLYTFADDLGAVELEPSREASNREPVGCPGAGFASIDSP